MSAYAVMQNHHQQWHRYASLVTSEKFLYRHAHTLTVHPLKSIFCTVSGLVTSQFSVFGSGVLLMTIAFVGQNLGASGCCVRLAIMALSSVPKAEMCQVTANTVDRPQSEKICIRNRKKQSCFEVVFTLTCVAVAAMLNIRTAEGCNLPASTSSSA